MMKPKKWRGADVKALRLKYNLSQAQFETLTGIGQSRVSDWENEIRQPSNLSCWALDMIEIKLKEHFETQTYDKEFNSMILIMLEHKNMSKTQLAKRIGISKQHLNRLLKNKIEWKLKHATEAMLALDFEFKDFEERYYVESRAALSDSYCF